MKIYFGEPEYDGQFLRSINYAPAGAQIGEAWAIAAQIEAGDATSVRSCWAGDCQRATLPDSNSSNVSRL
jgi:hypothetical protein